MKHVYTTVQQCGFQKPNIIRNLFITLNVFISKKNFSLHINKTLEIPGFCKSLVVICLLIILFPVYLSLDTHSVHDRCLRWSNCIWSPSQLCFIVSLCHIFLLRHLLLLFLLIYLSSVWLLPLPSFALLSSLPLSITFIISVFSWTFSSFSSAPYLWRPCVSTERRIPVSHRPCCWAISTTTTIKHAVLLSLQSYHNSFPFIHWWFLLYIKYRPNATFILMSAKRETSKAFWITLIMDSTFSHLQVLIKYLSKQVKHPYNDFFIPPPPFFFLPPPFPFANLSHSHYLSFHICWTYFCSIHLCQKQITPHLKFHGAVWPLKEYKETL